MSFPRVARAPILGSGPVYNSDVNWASGTLPAIVTHGGGANGTKWNSSGLLVAGSAGRITCDPATLVCLGGYFEGGRTNAIFPSQDMGSGNYYQDNAVVHADTVVSPDGTTNADTLAASSVITSAVDFGWTASAAAQSGKVAQSSFFKVAGSHPTNYGGLMMLGATGTNGFVSSVRNVATGAAGSTVVDGAARGTLYNSGAWNAGNSGWWRIWQTGQMTDTPYQTYQFDLSDAGTPSGGYDGFGQPLVTGQYEIVMWQWQIELGDFPSSPIITTSAAVTRSADTGTTTDATYIAQRGWLVEALTPLGLPASGTQIIAQWDDGTANNRWLVERDTAGNIHVRVVTSGVAQADMVSAATVGNNTAFKVAFRIATNDFAMSLNGASVVTDTSGTVPTITTGRFGTDTAGANYFYGIIARIRGATTLSNSDLVTQST